MRRGVLMQQQARLARVRDSCGAHGRKSSLLFSVTLPCQPVQVVAGFRHSTADKLLVRQIETLNADRKDDMFSLSSKEATLQACSDPISWG